MRPRAGAWGTWLAPVAALSLAWSVAHAHAQQPDSAAAGAMEIVVRPGDTLIALSRRVLAEPRRWPEVARHNGLANPHRLQPGTRLQVPLALLASEAAPATVLAASGTVRRTDAGPAPAPGTDLPEGTTLQTGADGHVVVRLVDGSVLRLRAGSEAQLREGRRYPAARLGRASVQLRDGRVEVQSPPAVGGRPGFRVTTPQGVLAVRGPSRRCRASRQRARGWSARSTSAGPSTPRRAATAGSSRPTRSSPPSCGSDAGSSRPRCRWRIWRRASTTGGWRANATMPTSARGAMR